MLNARGVPSGAVLFSYKNEIKMKNITPINESGLIQMMRIEKSIRHTWVITVIPVHAE